MIKTLSILLLLPIFAMSESKQRKPANTEVELAAQQFTSLLKCNKDSLGKIQSNQTAVFNCMRALMIPEVTDAELLRYQFLYGEFKAEVATICEEKEEEFHRLNSKVLWDLVLCFNADAGRKSRGAVFYKKMNGIYKIGRIKL